MTTKEIDERLKVLENRTSGLIGSIGNLANTVELLRQKVMEVTKDESKRSINKSVPSKRRK